MAGRGERTTRGRTCDHDLDLGFEVVVLRGALEEEVDVADHGQGADVVVGERVVGGRVRGAREDDEREL